MDVILKECTHDFKGEIKEYVYLMAIKFAEAEKAWYYAKQNKKRRKKNSTFNDWALLVCRPSS